MQGISSKPDFAYRPDIDGLRGIAILLVLAYHFNFPWITGGYIGVDIFFVISGYLITLLLQSHHQEKGKFLKNFYLRRIKRLLPLLLVVALVTTLLATVLFLPEDYISYLKSLRSALLFQSNSFFDSQAHDYFGPNVTELPLLHTWSLSIEWQFYFIFPLLYVFLISTSRPKIGKIVIFSLCLTLTLFSIYYVQISGEKYFSSGCRFFELLVGSRMIAWF